MAYHAFSGNGSYAIADIDQRIASFLERENIPYTDARFSIEGRPGKYLDPTDHLHAASVARISEVLIRSLVLADFKLRNIRLRDKRFLRIQP